MTTHDKVEIKNLENVIKNDPKVDTKNVLSKLFKIHPITVLALEYIDKFDDLFDRKMLVEKILEEIISDCTLGVLGSHLYYQKFDTIIRDFTPVYIHLGLLEKIENNKSLGKYKKTDKYREFIKSNEDNINLYSSLYISFFKQFVLASYKSIS